MEHKFNLNNFWLPADTKIRIPIGTIILDTEMEDEYITMMLKGICKAIHDSGYHEDSIGFAYHLCDKVLVLYKVVPALDIHDHLEPN